MYNAYGMKANSKGYLFCILHMYIVSPHMYFSCDLT